MKDVYYSKEMDYFLNRITNNEHFKYARYNDGELISVIGRTPNGSNLDNHKYFPQMSIDLKTALLNYEKSDDYILVSSIGWYNYRPEYKNIIDEITTKNPDVTFMDKCFMSHSHYKDYPNFIKFVELMKTKKVVVVGPDYMVKLGNIFPNFTHIKVPRKDCYLQKNNIINEIKNHRNQSNDDNYYLFSASMATNAMIEELKHDKHNSYLDCGAVWDTFFDSPEYDFIKKRTPCRRDRNKLIEAYKDYIF